MLDEHKLVFLQYSQVFCDRGQSIRWGRFM